MAGILVAVGSGFDVAGALVAGAEAGSDPPPHAVSTSIDSPIRIK